MAISVAELLADLPQVGSVTWIGLRPERRAPIEVVDYVIADQYQGLIGDRYSGSSGKRQVSIIQQEHLAVIASLLNIEYCAPELLRRNICVSGINLLALKGKTFQLGDAVLKFTGLCHPCSFMQTTLGAGGYNAVRGHGGITAQVVEGGRISLNDSVRVLNAID